jgi:hypothetical protein
MAWSWNSATVSTLFLTPGRILQSGNPPDPSVILRVVARSDAAVFFPGTNLVTLLFFAQMTQGAKRR